MKELYPVIVLFILFFVFITASVILTLKNNTKKKMDYKNAVRARKEEEEYLLNKLLDTEKRNLENKSISNELEKLTPSEDKELYNENELDEIVTKIEKAIDDELHRPTGNIRYSLRVDGNSATNTDDDLFNIDINLEPTFQELLFEKLNEKQMSNVEFYKNAWIDRKLFSTINSNKYYKPKKETAVACCFGLSLSLKESYELLKAAGYTLSDSIRWDKIINYCLEHDINRIEQVNQILDRMGEKCLGC